MRLLSLALVLAALAAPAHAQLVLEDAFPNLSFSSPIDFEHADDGTDRLYVAERAGIIRTFENDDEVATSNVFLDIENQVSTSGEGGLLGFAFHPNYTQNGFVYVSYTLGGPFRSRIARFTRSALNPGEADPDSEVVLLEIDQPFSNHNGGDLAFGPDGYLYASFGDGGSGGDPEENGQDPTTLLGTILRLDVDGGGAAPDCGGVDANYTIPDGADANALADGPGGACDEIFAYGLRNPFRFSFDRETGTLWAADVGQGSLEEVDIIENGDNLGWNTYEGSMCFDSPCDPQGLTFPVWEYGRSQGNSITGGFVYRGDDVPELMGGSYVYGDFGSGRIWALTGAQTTSPENEQLFDTSLGIASFGEDADGELYVIPLFGGEIQRFASETDTSGEGTPPAAPTTLALDGPNPFRVQTALAFSLAEPGPARVAVYDVLGREVAVLWDGAADDEVVTFDAADLPAGVYFVRLVAGAETRTERVLHVQ